MVEKRAVDLFSDLDGDEPVFHRVPFEDVGDGVAHHRSEAEAEERPGSVLAGGAAAEVLACDQNLGAFCLLAVEDEIGVAPPVGEEVGPEAFLGGGGEKARGDDLVGVHVVDGKDHRLRGDAFDRIHGYSIKVRASVIFPVTAAAAAVKGLARIVRPPFPWRPSKFRLLVETASSPGESWSPFMAMHIEQPGSRHSAPASRKIRSRPSAVACRFTSWEPGTTRARTPRATRRPFIIEAASLKSEIREFVQLPMNTTSTGFPRSFSPGLTPM